MFSREEFGALFNDMKAKPIATCLEQRGWSEQEIESVGSLSYVTLGDLADLGIEDFNRLIGALNFQRYSDIAYLSKKVRMLPYVARLAIKRDWQAFSGFVHSAYEVMPEAFEFFYPDMPTEYRREFVIGCYINHGNNVEGCRAAVRALGKGGATELPEEYRQLGSITVYRAGDEPIEEAARRISWTLDFDIAYWFLHEYNGRHAQHLYQAELNTSDVIAYTDERNEAEVLQYMSVYNVMELAF